jgi:hypothetical protein
MKRISLLVIVLSLMTGACLPAPAQPDASSATAPPEVDLEATAAILSQQTLQALPSFTALPSNTPVVVVETSTETLQNLTGSPTVTMANTGTLVPGASTATAGTTVTLVTSTVPAASITPNPLMSATLTGTAHPQHYGTMPPYLPFGQITLINKSKAEVYISLQCTTKDGFVSIYETPVSGQTRIKVPAGKYTYVAWVGGRQIVGKFSLGIDGNLKIKIFKDHLEIGS